VWNERAKDKEWTHKNKWVSEMSVWVPVGSFSLLLFYSLYLCNIFLSELPIVVILIHYSPFFIEWQVKNFILYPLPSGFIGLVVSMLASGTQVRGFKPGWSRRIFQATKILSMPSFRGEVKPSVPCRSFVACKRYVASVR
jgi:hypothetical protein